MTKNPRELTADWKDEKLDDGLYYIRLENGETPIAELETWYKCDDAVEESYKTEQEFFGYPKDIISEVLFPIPSYDHFVELKKKAEKYERIKVNGNYPDKISKLKSRIKKLLEKIEELESDSLAPKKGEENVAEQQAEINRLRKAINSALNFMACPDDLSELTGKCNDQAAFDELREALNNESEE